MIMLSWIVWSTHLVSIIQTNLPPQGLASDSEYAPQWDWVTESSAIPHCLVNHPFLWMVKWSIAHSFRLDIYAIQFGAMMYKAH